MPCEVYEVKFLSYVMELPLAFLICFALVVGPGVSLGSGQEEKDNSPRQVFGFHKHQGKLRSTNEKHSRKLELTLRIKFHKANSEEMKANKRGNCR